VNLFRAGRQGWREVSLPGGLTVWATFVSHDAR
jgi:hypothetical protein